MRALVVYESMFGNSRTIAQAIADGLVGRGMDVELVEVGQAELPDQHVGLLVVGAPTHAFSLSRPTTRASAADQASSPLVSTGRGLREWLDDLPSGVARYAAAFDTHVDKKVPGAACRAAERRLRRRGYAIALPAESFFVGDVQGPLVDGEVPRARRWGADLAAAAGAISRVGAGG
jgi:hypothetical protein